MENTSLQEALTLIKDGYSPFPIKGPEKVPNVAFSTVIIDSEEKAREYHWLSIGIHCGRSNVWILDIDDHNEKLEGFKWLDSVQEEHGEFPETRIVKTGGGGLQFHWDATGLQINSGTLATEVDVKGNVGNTFVCVPPTMHKSGKRYEYENRCKPAKAPDWLVELVKKVKLKTPISYRPSPIGGSFADDWGLPDVLTLLPPKNPHVLGYEIWGTHPDPAHGSKHGRNFWINTRKDTWCCQRHKTGGGRAEAYAVMKGIIKCEESVPGWLKKHYKEVITELRADGYQSKDGSWKEQSIRHGKEIMKRVWGI